MKEFAVTVKDPSGIHARPAGLIVKESGKYNSEIKIHLGTKEADAKRIFSVMALNAVLNDNLKITISGTDEEKAFSELKDFFNNNI